MGIRNASNLTASAQLAPGGGGGGLLWEWNGDDVSQFGDGDGTPTAVNGGTATGTLAAATLASSPEDVQTDKALVYTHSGGSNIDSYFIINDLPPLPERFRIVAHLGPRNSADLGVGSFPGIVTAWQDSTHFMRVYSNTGLNALLLATGNGSVGTSTVYSYSTSSVSSIQSEDVGTVVDVLCMLGEPSSGVDPRMQFNIAPMNSNTSARLIMNASAGGWGSLGGAVAPSTSWDSGWQTGGSIRQPGIMFRELGSAGSAYVGFFKIYEV